MALAFGIAGNASGFRSGAAALWGGDHWLGGLTVWRDTNLDLEPTGPMTHHLAVISFAATAESPARLRGLHRWGLGGDLSILFGLFRLGRYITMMPYTVISPASASHHSRFTSSHKFQV